MKGNNSELKQVNASPGQGEALHQTLLLKGLTLFSFAATLIGCGSSPATKLPPDFDKEGSLSGHFRTAPDIAQLAENAKASNTLLSNLDCTDLVSTPIAVSSNKDLTDLFPLTANRLVLCADQSNEHLRQEFLEKKELIRQINSTNQINWDNTFPMDSYGLFGKQSTSGFTLSAPTEIQALKKIAASDELHADPIHPRTTEIPLSQFELHRRTVHDLNGNNGVEMWVTDSRAPTLLQYVVAYRACFVPAGENPNQWPIPSQTFDEFYEATEARSLLYPEQVTGINNGKGDLFIDFERPSIPVSLGQPNIFAHTDVLWVAAVGNAVTDPINSTLIDGHRVSEGDRLHISGRPYKMQTMIKSSNIEELGNGPSHYTDKYGNFVSLTPTTEKSTTTDVIDVTFPIPKGEIAEEFFGVDLTPLNKNWGDFPQLIRSDSVPQLTTLGTSNSYGALPEEGRTQMIAKLEQFQQGQADLRKLFNAPDSIASVTYIGKNFDGDAFSLSKEINTFTAKVLADDRYLDPCYWGFHEAAHSEDAYLSRSSDKSLSFSERKGSHIQKFWLQNTAQIRSFNESEIYKHANLIQGKYAEEDQGGHAQSFVSELWASMITSLGMPNDRVNQSFTGQDGDKRLSLFIAGYDALQKDLNYAKKNGALDADASIHQVLDSRLKELRLLRNKK